MAESTPAPRRGRSLLRHDLTYGVWDSFLSTPLVFLTLPANLVIAALLTKVFNVDKGTYGVLVSLPSWFNFLQLFIVPRLRTSARRATIFFIWLQIASWAALLVALPFLPQTGPTAGRVLFILLACSALVTSITGVAWTTWMRDFVPGRVRGAHFGKRNVYATLATIAFLLLVTVATGRGGASVEPYMIIIGVALLMRVGGVTMQHLASEGVYRQEGRDWGLHLGKVFALKDFMLFVWVTAFIAFCINFVNPFLPVFMYEQLHLTVAQTTLYFLLSSVSGAAMMPVWGRLLDRHGYVPVIGLSLLLMSCSDLGWLFANPGRTWIVPLLWLGYGLTSPGYLMGIVSMLMKLIPRDVMVGGVSVNLAITSIMAAVAPMLAGAFFDWGPRWLGSVDAVYRVGFIAKPALILASLLVLRRVKEPPAAGVPTMLGAMRTMRQVMMTTGLSFLSNFNFPRRWHRRQDPRWVRR